MGLKRSKGPKSFVGDCERQLFDFYGNVVQGLRPWTARAPRLPKEEPDGVREVDAEEPLAPSVQDLPERGSIGKE